MIVQQRCLSLPGIPGRWSFARGGIVERGVRSPWPDQETAVRCQSPFNFVSHATNLRTTHTCVLIVESSLSRITYTFDTHHCSSPSSRSCRRSLSASTANTSARYRRLSSTVRRPALPLSCRPSIFVGYRSFLLLSDYILIFSATVNCFSSHIFSLVNKSICVGFSLLGRRHSHLLPICVIALLLP